MIINVIIPLALNEPFSYYSEDNIEIGSLVYVPFGNKTYIGLVVETNIVVKDGIKLKNIKEKINIKPLQKELIDFIKWTSDYNLIPLGNVLKMVIAPLNFLKDKVGKFYGLSGDFDVSGLFNDISFTSSITLHPKEGRDKREETKEGEDLPSLSFSPLRGRVMEEVINKKLKFNTIKTTLTQKQKLIIAYFLKHKLSSKKDILDNTKVGESVLKNLIKIGIIKEILSEIKLKQNIGNFKLNELSNDQKKAFDFICEDVSFFNKIPSLAIPSKGEGGLPSLSPPPLGEEGAREGVNISLSAPQTQTNTLKTLNIEENITQQNNSSNFQVFVLEGTTGSGKTEVYFHLIAKLLKETEKQALILLPEIALTTQLINRFKEQFNFGPALWHSEITQAQKNNIFKGVLANDVRVIIGTRSSLFLPFQKLGLIIVDEEHDTSYKQNENGCFHGRDLAIIRAKINNISIVLASATPSLETLINIDKGKYKKVYLPSRYGKAVMPNVEIVDMKKQKLKKDKYISTPLKNAIQNNLNLGKQSMLFMNRRGYSPVILCADCGEKLRCPNCSSNLNYHKSKNRVICHHCEYFIERPNKCPNCASENLIEFGPGVEKIENEIKEYFPHAKTIIMSSDTTDTNKKLEDIINKILNKEIDIIIGTQLVAKGHHFPSLTVVGVIDSDASLFGGDIRASEKTFQLLTQISGRAGREETKGDVYFQSYNSDNLILQAIKEGNKELLLDFEKQNRELGNFPPFGKMATIYISSSNEVIAYRLAKKIASRFPLDDNIEILGPAPAIIARVAKMFKFNVILKTSKNVNIQKLLKKIVLSEKYNGNVRIKIEIN